MSEESEMWREYKDQQKQRRAERLPARTDEINRLAEKGFDLKWLTTFQCRVNGVIDLYPIHNRYHFIKTGKRGSYQNAFKFVLKNITTPKDD